MPAASLAGEAGRTAGFSDFVDLMRYRAAQTPELPVYTFVHGSERVTQVLTCSELDRRAGIVAAALGQACRVGDRVLLLFAPGIEYIVALFGCMYAGVIAVPAYPVEPAQAERTARRLASIVENSAPAAVLTTSAIMATAARVPAATAGLDRTRCIPVDALHETDDVPAAPRVPDAQPVYLQYTSGSTGAPKGVMISHRNLLHNSELIARRFEHDASSRGVIWLPPYHDMGLIGGILQPLYAGFPVMLMSHVDFLKHPMRWLRAVSKFRATTSGGPNFAYQMLATMRLSDVDLEGVDLSSWSLAFVGAEPIRSNTLRAFAQRFARCGFRAEAFYPCYGLAEHTLFMTGGRKSALPVAMSAPRGAGQATAIADEPTVAIGCGSPSEDSVVMIVDPETGVPCEEGIAGEIWAQGSSVSAGYWNNEPLTRETFGGRLPGFEGRFMRSGDYGYCLSDQLFVTGRLKDMIPIHGANHYPHDIEATIEDVDAEMFRAGGAAVFAVERGEAIQVVVVRELRARYLKIFDAAGQAGVEPPDALFGRLRQAITRCHGIAVHRIVFTSPSAIPKTTSGKVQRYACRDLVVEGTLPIVAQWHTQTRQTGVDE